MKETSLSIDLDGRRELQFSATLSGTLNGLPLDLSGQGVINEHEGLTHGRYDIRRLPEDVDSRSLGAFLMTGYPNSCETRNTDVGNPFSGAGYSYRRIYTFESGEEACLDMTCELERDRLASHFHLSGSAPSLAGVRGIGVIEELWDPKPHQIAGTFHVAWSGQQEGASVARATARSRYLPAHVERMKSKRKYRLLELEACVDAPDNVVIVQRSKLVSSPA